MTKYVCRISKDGKFNRSDAVYDTFEEARKDGLRVANAINKYYRGKNVTRETIEDHFRLSDTYGVFKEWIDIPIEKIYIFEAEYPKLPYEIPQKSSRENLEPELEEALKKILKTTTKPIYKAVMDIYNQESLDYLDDYVGEPRDFYKFIDDEKIDEINKILVDEMQKGLEKSGFYKLSNPVEIKVEI